MRCAVVGLAITIALVVAACGETNAEIAEEPSAVPDAPTSVVSATTAPPSTTVPFTTTTPPTSTAAPSHTAAPTSPAASSPTTAPKSATATAAPPSTAAAVITAAPLITAAPRPAQPYDADEYFEVFFEGANFICQDRSFWNSFSQQYDCVRYFGGSAPLIMVTELYCSGSTLWPTCSRLWYPDELDDHNIYEISGNRYICKSAYFGSWGDKDCYRYTGGDPRRAIGSWADLYCSGGGSQMTCSTDEYPSVWQNYSLVTIGWQEYICDKGVFGEMPCVRYWGGSPSRYLFFSPEYYCSRYGGSCYQR